MKMLEVQTCPLWEDSDGSRRPGLEYEPDHPPVVGWVNVAVITIDGRPRLVLLTLDAGH